MPQTSETKINRLLQKQPKNVVYTSKWMLQEGYSAELQRTYREGQWFRSIGRGAMVRTGDKVDYRGALYALQRQLNLLVHLGGENALEIHGLLHYLKFSNSKVTLFGTSRLPAWFTNHDWGTQVDFHFTNFLPEKIGLKPVQMGDLELIISSPVRAFLEVLWLLKDPSGFVPAYEILLGMNNFRPQEVQDLLERCSSVKVKRLFLFMAEKAGHRWFDYLKTDHLDLGKGKRSLVTKGAYDSKYRITLPQVLIDYE